MIPAAESAIFSEDLRRKGADVHVLLSGLITHAEVNRAATYIDVWKLISLWAQVFKSLELVAPAGLRTRLYARIEM